MYCGNKLVYCEVMWVLQWENDINLLVFNLPTNHDFGKWKHHLFEILFLTHLKRICFKNFS